MDNNPKPSLLPHQLIHPNHRNIGESPSYPFSIFNPVPPRSNTRFPLTNPYILPKEMPPNTNFQAHIGPLKAAMDREMNFPTNVPRRKRAASKRKPRKVTTRAANTLNRVSWNAYEDRLLANFVREFGEQKWSEVAKMLDRGGKQCRDRWFNQLRPNIRKVGWSEEEDKMLIEAHKVVGNKWAKISKEYLPGRSENSIKNHWNATMRSHLTRLNLAKKKKRNRFHGKKLYSLLEDYIMSVLTAAPAPAAGDDVIIDSNENLPAMEDCTKSVIAAAPAPPDDDVIIDSNGKLPAMEEDESSQGSGDDNGGEGSSSMDMDMDMYDMDVEALLSFDLKEEMKVLSELFPSSEYGF